jgi:hypothetical protein
MHDAAHLDHASHDLSLIAGHAAGDLSNPETAAAAALLASCTSCSNLHRDLVAIASATRDLPRTARSPRDFRITADQAERLHRGSRLRTLLRPFASARSATRPLAAAFTSVGVAGLLVAAFVPAMLGGAASAPSRDSLAGGPAATHAPAPAPADQEADTPTYVAQGAAGAPSDDANYVKSGSSAAPVAVGGGRNLATDDRGEGDAAALNADTSGRLGREAPANLLFLGSLALLTVGVVLFGLRFAARRLR